jgi:hypothetical protein
MLSVGSFFGRGFDSHRLHHFFDDNLFFFALAHGRFCGRFLRKMDVLCWFFVVFLWSVCGVFVVLKRAFFGLEEYANF